jgi:cytochrome P450
METTSRAVEFALYALAVFPEFQTKLQVEIDQYKEFLGGRGVRDWSYTESRGLTYALAIMVSFKQYIGCICA